LIEEKSSFESFEESDSRRIAAALEKVLEYIERCRISGLGGAADDDGKGSSWAKEQAALKPTLLPDLKFHDLVFGQ
jgi:hypothetical protein